MALTLQWRGKVYGVPRGILTRGQLSTHKGLVPAAIGDLPMGIVMDDAASESPLTMVDLYGEGSVIRDTTLTLTEDSIISSDGDGTWSTADPGAGGWVIGLPVGPDSFIVHFERWEA